jgi:hypothetical protein
MMDDTTRIGSVSSVDQDQIVLELDNIRELFIAPEFDPFSEKETEYMGHSAITRIIRQLGPGWTFQARHMRLVIRLPPDQITPGTLDQVRNAIRRFCGTKMDDNKILIRQIHWNGFRKLPFGFGFLAVCLSLGALFRSGALTGMPAWLSTTLDQGMTIIGWVALTMPAQTILFDPLPIKRENVILKTLLDMPVEIQQRQ